MKPNAFLADSFGVITDPGTVRIERLLPGPIERVWSYLVDSEKRSQWLAAGSMDLSTGGKVALQFKNASLSKDGDRAPAKYAEQEHCADLQGRITKCEPPRLLSFTWGDNSDPSEVRFDLEPQGGKVLLTVTHRRIVGRGQMLSISSGWHAHLDILAARLADQTPPSFWAHHTALEAEYGKRLS